ncbi:MAG: DUF5360 family protein [Myxococcota bacterium]
MRDSDFIAIRPWLWATDIGMLAYWGMTIANGLGWIHIPPAWLYSDALNPVVVDWNWSFLPIDLAFSFCGLGAAVAFHRRSVSWKPLLLASLGLTFCAGFMALSFWGVRCEFDLTWWVLNAYLVLFPSVFLLRFASRGVMQEPREPVSTPSA